MIFPSPGALMDGGQFHSDAGFDVLDWNDDGKPDLYVYDGGSTGYGWAYLNEGSRDEPRFDHGVWYPFNSTETTPQTIEHVQSRTLCKLTQAGFPDIIFFDGQLRFCPNTGTAHGPFHWKLWNNPPSYFPGSATMIQENSRFSTGPESMYWNKGIFPRQVLTLTAADCDGDGLEDLLICRTIGEAPGVKALMNVREEWTAWGRMATQRPDDSGTATPDPTFLVPLKEPPPRGLYFYKNVGTRSQPFFDQGVAVRSTDGKPVVAPNPIVADVDGDGVPDIISTEVPYRCNAFRVDWPTQPYVMWFRRHMARSLTSVEPGQPLRDAAGKPIPAGTMVRLADFRRRGVLDLLVMDPGGTVRWYQNTAQNARQPLQLVGPIVLRGRDFCRFSFMFQPLVVNWFGPNSRDLILHGLTDPHCKWGLRRTALYRNTATRPGEMRYEFSGWFNFNGDPALVPVSVEERHYEAYGSALSVFPDDGTGKKRFMVSVGGKLFFFSDLAADGLTFRKMKRIEIAGESNRRKGWQEIPVDVPFKIKAIRINNDRNGMGNLRDSLLHVERFEALCNGENLATTNRVTVTTPVAETKGRLMINRPLNMLLPGNANTETEFNASSWGYYLLAAEIAWPEPVKLDKIRFLLSNRDSRWYASFVPFYWQGKLFRTGMEEGENWYQYRIEVSPDGQTWTNLINWTGTEMLTSHPVMVDWDKDGKADMLLGSTSANGIYPNRKQYRLYRNIGSNDDPKFADPIPATDASGNPISPSAHWFLTYAPQGGVVPVDLNGDGRRDLVVEENMDGKLDYYENIASNTPAGFIFKKAGSLCGDNDWLLPGNGHRYFDIADVDGDGIPDLLHSVGELRFFKGVVAGSPKCVTDLTAASAGPAGVRLRWTRPAGAPKYLIRWSEAREIGETDWAILSGTNGIYTATNREPQYATIQGLPPGKNITLAIKSLDVSNRVSGISQLARLVTPPLKEIVLRNGPADGTTMPAYSNCWAVTLDAAKPDTVDANRATLKVFAQIPKGEKQKVMVVHFGKMPLPQVERAELVLYTSGAMATMMSCNAIGDEVAPTTATWNHSTAGVNWPNDELNQGGDFQSFAAPMFVAGPDTRVAWDVTKAVNRVRKAGLDSVTFLIRVDYTGHYVAGEGKVFVGTSALNVEQRPRLILITNQ